MAGCGHLKTFCVCLFILSATWSSRAENGGIYREDKTFRLSGSPFVITKDIEVAKGAKLTIEPGVEVRFKPGIKLVVNGTLIAKGSAGNRIKFTKDPSEPSSAQPNKLVPGNIRLVAGLNNSNVLEGRLQFKYKDRWRSVCTDFKNWTQEDSNVVCHHLGFRSGNFSFNFTADNETLYQYHMAFPEPRCNGTETDMFNCPGSNSLKIGWDICKKQRTVYIRCEDRLYPDFAKSHWHGINFYNATTEIGNIGGLVINVSMSKMEYIDIEYGGVDFLRRPVASLTASPYPPYMKDVRVQYSAYHGMNFSEINGTLRMDDVYISHNRGHGMLIKSQLGRVFITNSVIEHNGGDGVHMRMVPYSFESFLVEKKFTFCQRSSVINEKHIFPMVIHGLPSQTSPCSQEFRAPSGQVITLHVLLMDISPQAEGYLEVYDIGRDFIQNNPDRLLANLTIVNGTLYGMPQSVTSPGNIMSVRFNWRVPDQGCFVLSECMKFTLEVTAGVEKSRELELKGVSIRNNLFRGVTVENMRSKVQILDSDISYNQYEAGIRIYEGAGDVIINNTVVMYNHNAGINITYSGGRRVINNTMIKHNFGYGMFIEHVKVNRTRNESEQITEVLKSQFHFNEGIGLRVGNYCRAGVTVINETTSFIGNGGDGVEFWSCLETATGLNNITMQWVTFDDNRGQALRAKPMLNAEGHIWNCTFKNSRAGAIWIDNTDETIKTRLYQGMRVNYFIDWNRFENISGRFAINVRLNPASIIQKLEIKFNWFVNNVITQGFTGLNPRSTASGLIIASSSGVLVHRNDLSRNPAAYKLISTHLLDPSTTIDCNYNFFGKPKITGSTQDDWDKMRGEIFRLIFDKSDRYNLARIDIKKILRYDNLHTDQYPDGEAITDNFERKLDDGTFLIGGEVSLDYTAKSGKTYRVDSDIHILDQRKFEVQTGAKLYFDNSIGMLVQGKLVISGDQSSKVLFSKAEENLYRNNTNLRVEGLNEKHEGLVEVMVDSQWGTICNLGWTIQDAAIVCQSFGMTLDPDDWIVSNPIRGSSSAPILLSNVDCSDIDVDITQCRADHLGEHSCDHSMDANVKCKPSTWAGIRMTATAAKASLKHVTIEKAGLMDYARREYVSALEIDYNYHTLEDIVIRQSLSHGLGIMFNDVYSENKIMRSTFQNNADSGVVTRASYLHMRECTFDGNGRAGFEYNPSVSEHDAKSVRSMIMNPYFINEDQSIGVKIDGTPTFVLTKPGEPDEDSHYFIEFYPDQGNTRYRLTVMILDYNPDTATEKVIFHLGKKDDAIKGTTRKYDIEDDLVDFPLVSVNDKLTMEYRVKGQRTGRLSLVMHAYWFTKPHPNATIQMHKSEMKNNERGMQTIHYNSPSNERLNLFVRYKNEAITLDRVKIHNNKQEAMYVPSLTKYHEEFMPSIDEVIEVKRVGHVNYTVRLCEIYENGKGVLAEHNHVRFANTFWTWHFLSNKVTRNKGGGFGIELPKVPSVVYDLDISLDKTKFVSLNHSVVVNYTLFEDNEGFEFAVLGFYTNLTIAHNIFRRNKCKNGLIRIAGMEKYMNFTENSLTDNIGRYVMEFDIRSHAEFSKINDSYIFLNTIQNNQYFPGTVTPTVAYEPQSYAVAIRGVSNVTLYHNLFGNPDLEYELIADQPSSHLYSYLNVTLNWWGTSTQSTIRERIFDFDDWNNYGIARFIPYLLSNSFTADIFKGAVEELQFDINKPWRGRISRDTVIPKRDRPYEVESDVTVLPGVTLVIEPKVEVLFRPNIGILVLGNMIARGREFERIRFGPMKKPSTSSVKKVKRDVPSMRLVGGDYPNEGFLQLLNETNKQWSLICDPYFNDKTAEVFCTDLGMERTNVHVRFTDLFEYRYYGNRFFREKFVWHRSVQCSGTETSIEQCNSPINYHMKTCSEQENFVFIRCGERNLGQDYEYWGNIRFSSPDYESDMKNGGLSVLEYIDIEGAGILHGEKIAAVQAVYQTPVTNNVEIKNCASNGFDFVSPRSGIAVYNSRLWNNIGYGVGVLGLNGESGHQPISSFEPLNNSIIPHNLFGLVRMCDAEKDVYVQDRILLYYKYEYASVDCVKVIRSRVQAKSVILRFLQVNLFQDRFERNSIEVFDGDYFDHEYRLATIDSNATREILKTKYESSKEKSVLSIHMHASPGPPMYGFIAEIVTIPLAQDTGVQHKVQGCDITQNQGGAIMYMNVGEANPAVSIRASKIYENGVAFMNLTSYPNIYLNIQNTRESTLSNNYIFKNKGGVLIQTYAASLKTAYPKNLTNNLFMFTHNGPALTIEGDLYEKVDVKRNYIAHNYVIYRDSIVFRNISLNFSNNVVVNNTGAHIIDIQGIYELAKRQYIVYNGIHNNTASGGEHFQTTIYARSPHIEIHENFIENWLNALELTTHNRSRRYLEPHYSVKAQRNWWGQSEWWRPPNERFVAGKIYDRTNDWEYLVPVDFKPFFTSNSSVLDGKCRPGWARYENRCYLLFGGTVTYQEAVEACAFENATLAFGLDRLFNLTLAMKHQQGDYDRSFGAWIRYGQKKNPGLCSVVRNERYFEEECTMNLPFICEHDPYGVSQPLDWRLVALISGCCGAGFLLLLFILICWVIKSRQRKVQRLERRNSIRASIRSSRSMRSQMSRASRDQLTEISEINGMNGRRALRPPPSNRYNISGTTLDETTDSIEEKKVPPSSTLDSTIDYPSKFSSFNNTLEDSKHPPRLENEIPNISARPQYDMVFENRGYEDSFDQSQSRESTLKVKPPWKASQETFTSVDDDEKPPPSSLSSFGKHSSMEELSTVVPKTKPHYANVKDQIHTKPSSFYTPPARLRGNTAPSQQGLVYANPMALEQTPSEPVKPKSHYVNAGFDYPDYQNTLPLPSRETEPTSSGDESRHNTLPPKYKETSLDDLSQPRSQPQETSLDDYVSDASVATSKSNVIETEI